MKIGITGASGLIGKYLCRNLEREGCGVVPFTRRRSTNQIETHPLSVVWDPGSGPLDPGHLDGLDAVVHLAGEPIARRRWSKRQKRLILDSRLNGTRNLVETMRLSVQPPRTLISASAVGFYGDRKSEELDENSERGEGFLADVCGEWEREALAAAELGVRVVLLRTGIVLARDGGALSKMLLPFRFYLGGPLGNGEQFMPWIHIEDEIRLISFALRESEIQGPLNATAPNPATNREFTSELCRILNRPQMPAVPEVALRVAAGEMGRALLLEGQRVFPRKSLEAGFSFRFPVLGEALQDLLG
ncbi:MAG TPA: TIGR01777 family oxidoreductase [Acidobacteriota bacterium]|nr:TIGR01777 family oxidoreductase [Acidobacteriota bacterium]